MRANEPMRPSEAEVQALNLAYLPRLTVPDTQDRLDAAGARSQRVRDRLECRLDVPYGPSPLQALDVFPAGKPGSPVLFFIHGGYWRALDKQVYSEIAAPAVEAGATVVMPNYDLCPAVTITDIVEQIRCALAWTHANVAGYGGDPGRIHVCGHSAGGHLTGMMMTTDWAARGLPADLLASATPLSGLFDIEPHRHTDLQADIRLSWEEAAANSPQFLELHCRCPVLCAVGGGEPEAFHAQSRDFAEKCGAQGLDCRYLETGDDNHFQITDRLGRADDPLTRSLIATMGL